MLFGEDVPRRYRVVDPRTGALVSEGERDTADGLLPDEGEGPRVCICSVDLYVCAGKFAPTRGPFRVSSVPWSLQGQTARTSLQVLSL